MMWERGGNQLPLTTCAAGKAVFECLSQINYGQRIDEHWCSLARDDAASAGGVE